MPNEESKAMKIEKEYEKYKEQKELAKRKKQKEANELESLRQQVEAEKQKESHRKEYVANIQEKQRLQKELSDLKSAKYKAVTQNVKNVFSNIGTTFGKVGEGLAGKPTGQPAQARPIPVRRKVQPSMQTITQQPQGFDFAKMMGFDNSAPQQTQISQTRVRDARMRAVKRKLKNSKRTTIPRIRRINRMPMAPTVTQKPFDINDVLRGMPQ